MYSSVVGHTTNKICSLSDRNQFVRIHGDKSDTSFIKLGGPHGSILGPTLFTLYVNDSPDFITAGELYMLADNTDISAVSNNTDAMNKTMQVYSRPSLNLVLCMLTD